MVIFPALFEDVIDLVSWSVWSFSLAKVKGFAILGKFSMMKVGLGGFLFRSRLHRVLLGILRLFDVRHGDSGLVVLLEMSEFQAQSLPGGHKAGRLGHIEEDNGCSFTLCVSESCPRSTPNQLVV